MAFAPTPRQRRWLDALLILSTIAVAFLVTGFLASVFFAFGDIILIFFLAWLLAFIISPVATRLSKLVPFLNRVGAVILVYSLLLGGAIVAVVLIAGAMATSIGDFINNVPTLRTELPEILAPWQQRLNDLGLEKIDLVKQATIFLDNLNVYAAQLVGPLQSFAVASLGALGNLLLVLILSLYIVIDRDRILSFFFRIVPPSFKEEARLLETSVAASFGGFLRGQALVGLIYGVIATVTSGLLGLPYLPVTSAAAGVLQAIPFFGPFVSWTPPVLVAIVAKPEATLPALILMGVGWFVLMNILQPRLMQETVGIHPIVVLGSVLVGSKIAGITGAIFGIPIVAVMSAFFFYYLGQSHDTGPVAQRAARRLEAREGRPVRVPREPAPGVDWDVDDPLMQARPLASDEDLEETLAQPLPPSASSPAAGPSE